MTSAGNNSSATTSAADDHRIEYQGPGLNPQAAAVVANSAALAKPELGAEKWLASVMADRKAGTMQPYLSSI